MNESKQLRATIVTIAKSDKRDKWIESNYWEISNLMVHQNYFPFWVHQYYLCRVYRRNQQNLSWLIVVLSFIIKLYDFPAPINKQRNIESREKRLLFYLSINIEYFIIKSRNTRNYCAIQIMDPQLKDWKKVKWADSQI